VSWNMSVWGNVNVTVRFSSVGGQMVHSFTFQPRGRRNVPPAAWPISLEDYKQVAVCHTTFLPSSRCPHCNVSGQWHSTVSAITRQGRISHCFGSLTHETVCLSIFLSAIITPKLTKCLQLTPLLEFAAVCSFA